MTEEQQLRPLSPYAVSKVAQDLLAHQYFAVGIPRSGRGLSITMAPGVRVFVTSAFARQITD